MRYYAHVTPGLLIAARERLHMSPEVAAKKLRVSLKRLSAWEDGSVKPTIRQLRIAARAYRQSLAFFYLPSVPEDLSPSLTDFRMPPDSDDQGMPPELAREIRECSIRRDVALEMMELRSDSQVAREFSLIVDRNEGAEQVAEELRTYLSVRSSIQQSWRNNRVAFNGWRHAIELAGILVFQAVDIPVKIIRGFSIARFPLPAIVVNRKDALAGRMFSMLHELVHLGLRTSAVCDMIEYRGMKHDNIEVFCNHVAGATLVPERDLRLHEYIQRNPSPMDWREEAIEELARVFSVSRIVIVRRLLTLNLTTHSFYERKQAEYGSAVPFTRSGFVSPSVDSLSRNGLVLTRLVLNAMHEGTITANDASDYLGVRLKHFDKIAEQIGV